VQGKGDVKLSCTLFFFLSFPSPLSQSLPLLKQGINSSGNTGKEFYKIKEIFRISIITIFLIFLLKRVVN